MDIRKQLMKPFTFDQALLEASRCLLCEDAPCEKGCPSSVRVKDFIRNIRFGNLRGAYHIIKSDNIFGASCARICNSSNTCKKYCTNEKLSKPIEIDKLQQYVCDMYVGDDHHVETKNNNEKKIAIIGGGPSGLSAAYELHRNGCNVTVFEKEAFLGGILYSGIPNYRLPNGIVTKETSFIKNLGIKTKMGREIPDLNELIDMYDAIILAIGMQKTILPKIPGVELNGVYTSKDILKAHKLKERFNIGKEVVVIGGGNSAFDSAQAAKSLGANNVTIVYRRSENEVLAWEKEKKVSRALGISVRYLASLVEIRGINSVTGIKCQLMEFTDNQDKDGRQCVKPIDSAYFNLIADNVIFATGEKVDNSFLNTNSIKISSKNHLTNIAKIFTTGDIILDEKSVAHSVGNGKSVAKEVMNFLGLTYSENIKKYFYGKKNINLSTTFCGVKFENPFVLAAAPPTDDLEMLKDAFSKGWAGAVLKTTSLESNEVQLKYPMMSGIKFNNKNLMGLGNIDLISEHHIDVVEKRVKELKKCFPEKVVIASIMGEKKEDWENLVKRLENANVDMIECSFSCPQGTLGSKPGFMLGQDAKLVKKVAKWIKDAAKRVPIIIKITPQVTDIVEIATAIKESGADGICASNSIPSLMGVNLDTFVPFPNVSGKSTYSGYTGAAIKPITLRNIAEIKKKVDVPITGTGGPINFKDALEFISVGASNVQFCTAVMHYGFDIIDDLRSGLSYYMLEKEIKSISEIVGKAIPNIISFDELKQKRKIVSYINSELCIKCGNCYVSCKDGGHRAIDFNRSTREFLTNSDNCVGCAFCINVCPIEGCIVMKEL